MFNWQLITAVAVNVGLIIYGYGKLSSKVEGLELQCKQVENRLNMLVDHFVGRGINGK